MIVVKDEIANLLKVLRNMEHRDAGGYSDFSPIMESGYDRWNNYRKESSNSNHSHWVLLGVHLERAYEALYERGYLTLEELNESRTRIFEHYITEMQPVFFPEFCPDIKGGTSEDIVEKATLYRKAIDFHMQDQSEFDSSTTFFLEALGHIEAMDAKMRLGIGGVDDYCRRYDKEIMGFLFDSYLEVSGEDGNIKKFNKARGRVALARKELDTELHNEY